MLFMGDKYQHGISGYGPVCMGTKRDRIDWNTENGKNFAKLVCQEMGFKEAQFLGLHDAYDDFTKQNNMMNEGKFY